jgi:hypothetical protein
MVRRVGAVTVVAVLVAALIWLIQWWTHPTLFGPPGDAVGYNRATVGLPVHFGITYPGAPDGVGKVTIESISPKISKNTSQSKITFSVCNEGAAVIGVAKGRLEKLCTDVRPATDVHLAPHEYILMTTRATTPGVLDIHNFEVTYRYGWGRLRQHGTEQTGIRVTVATTR